LDNPAEPSTPQRGTLQMLEFVAGIAAPLTLATALLAYVGWIRSRAYFGYFGLNTSLVSYTPQDYLLQSAPVGFGAILVLVLAGTVLLTVDRATAYGLSLVSRTHEIRIRRALVGVGLILIVFSLWSAAPQATMGVLPSTSGAMLLGIGAFMVLRFGGRQRQDVQPIVPSIGIGLAVVALALAAFWAATVHAEDLGRGAAESVDRDPRRLSVVTVYSREPLDLPGANVTPVRMADENQQWNYRYTGARLLIYSNDRWFLMPEPSSSIYRSSVSILPDTDAIRVEVAVPH
jgi:hypothetical protein